MLIDLNPLQMLFLLFVAHNLADFPLQGEFMSQAKNRNTDIGAMFWKWALPGHALIHGGFVFLITGSLLLGVAETVIHAFIDFLKCEGDISLAEDQFAHYGFKVLWVLVAWACF